MPGLTVRVHDAYVAGEGVLYASLLGLFPMVDMRGTGEVAMDERSARATLTEGDISVTKLFTFDGQGFIESVRAEARGRTVGGQVVPTTWRGRSWNYQECGGMRVPLDGEVAWLLPEGDKPYWRGRIV